MKPEMKPVLQLDDLGAHLHAQRRVEVGERLVHQEHAHDRPVEGDALPLTAAKLSRTPLQDLLDAKNLRRFWSSPRSWSSPSLETRRCSLPR